VSSPSRAHQADLHRSSLVLRSRDAPRGRDRSREREPPRDRDRDREREAPRERERERERDGGDRRGYRDAPRDDFGRDRDVAPRDAAAAPAARDAREEREEREERRERGDEPSGAAPADGAARSGE
jgi:hypothetical protein